jgi:hypothetical protein
MTVSPLLAPVVVLIAWSLVMFVWLAIARAPYVRGRLPNGARGADVEREHPGKPNWPAHNYMHLMEQPTIFYAIVFVLVFEHFDAPMNVYLAWGYVGLRIVHSIVQATVNVVRLRFTLFALATVCLAALTLHAAMFILRH